MKSPFASKVSKKISATYSLFSGLFIGGSVCPSETLELVYQDEDVFTRLATQELMDGAVPELLHHLPVVDHTSTHQVRDVVRLRVRESIITNVKVELVALHL